MSGAAWCETPAEPAAKAWLAEIDAGRYAQAWSDADPLVQGASTSASFSQTLDGARRPLGAELERVLAGQVSANSLPGAPDGTYVVLTYRTRFSQKAQATETLVMRKEAGGWEASGYHIR